MGTPIVTRADFRALSDARLREARALMRAKQWSGAYYLTGYAVELALKAGVIEVLMGADRFPGRDFTRDCYTHDLRALVRLVGPGAAWDAARRADPDFRGNSETVADWDETSRYTRWSRAEAQGLYRAATDADHGVLPWVSAQFSST